MREMLLIGATFVIALIIALCVSVYVAYGVPSFITWYWLMYWVVFPFIAQEAAAKAWRDWKALEKYLKMVDVWIYVHSGKAQFYVHDPL